MKHPIIEHHYEVATGRWTEVHADLTTNIRKTAEALADRRRESNLPPTLAHWTVGDHMVAGQNLMELAKRQGFFKTE